jgi:hypothetical protein
LIVNCISSVNHTALCPPQSGYTVYNLSQAPKLLGLAGAGRASHQFYEVGHGKNESDRLGAVAKAALLRGLAGEAWDQSPTTVEEIAGIIDRNLPKKGKEDFFKVIVMPPLERADPATLGYIPVQGSRKMYSLVRTEKGEIVGQALSCRTCAAGEVGSACLRVN